MRSLLDLLPRRHPPAQPPVTVTHVELRLVTGATIVYPVRPPVKLTRPPQVIDIIGGVAFIDERQS